MCYLCLISNPLDIKMSSKTEDKKNRAKEIKFVLNMYEKHGSLCDVQSKIDALKEEQYKLSREI